jgi:hypothetical protein
MLEVEHIENDMKNRKDSKPKRKPTASGSWESLVGCAAYHGPRKSIREMDEAVSAMFRKQYLPSKGSSAKR